jgi:tRNA-specific 2-thiouridylase
MKNKMKALAMFSGGLDSLLSIYLITSQGIEVKALYFDIGFGGKSDKKQYLEEAVKKVGATLEIVDIKDQFISEILFDPKFGYGKNFNPCIDCHANMAKTAYSLLEKYDASFIISGEVLGQRPMSQRAEAMNNVVQLSQTNNLLLRPLCAKLMPITVPEEKGWVDRNKLLGINGRSRKEQIALANKIGLENYESPAGGCLLTDINFSIKMKEHIKNEDFILEDIIPLKLGRHLRLPNGAKVIISRNHEENEQLTDVNNPKLVKIKPKDIKGPVAFVSKNANEEDIILALRLILTYSKSQANTKYDIDFENKTYNLEPFESKDVAKPYFVI